jgi:hypothetical protein
VSAGSLRHDPPEEHPCLVGRRPPPPPTREVGEADGELPALVERAAARRLDELALVGRVGVGVGVGVPDVPLDVLAEADTHSSNPCSSPPKGVLSAVR